MKRIFKYTLFLFIGLIMAMLAITFLTKSVQPKVSFKGAPSLNPEAYKRLGEIVQFQTVSYDDSSDGILKTIALKQLYIWMQNNYPLVFKNAKSHFIGTGSLILEFPGNNNSLKPAMFCAHLDVVPVDMENISKWKKAPFSGAIWNDTIYGRGVLDDKSVAISMLEVMEKRIAKKALNKRTILLAFGHDEETGGTNGAIKIAHYLLENKIQPEFICDEGFGVMEGLVPGVKKPVAIIGIAEKGYMTAKLEIALEGGHSSFPKKENATSILIKALQSVENMEMRETFCEPQQQFFRSIAPEANFGYRFLFSNMWIASPVIKMVLRGNNKTAATIRTTHATTIIRSGTKDNTLPGYAQAMVNFRILPGETVQSVYEHLKRTIADERVQIVLQPDTISPSPISSTKNLAWKWITETIGETFDGAVSAPGLVLTGTDCKNYTSVCKNIYRFVPLRLNNDNLGGIHGSNERIATGNFNEMIRYYELLFEKL
ncbi:MAG: M20/M25/M40 family metallo-hydrolase [Bacteroidetes bacterium]|nr:M20/M25/M40 family metallo-hydrolase [Bacteroidota bacterium]